MTTKEVIEQIHDEFNTAGEKLLAEAKQIVNEGLLKKANRLEKIGFIKSKEVIESSRMKISKTVSDLVLYYQNKYPNNKFITEDQVKQINKKYNLVCAPISRFKGFVPVEKLTNIENANIHQYDKDDKYVRLKNCWDSHPFQIRRLVANRIHREMNMELIPATHPDLHWIGQDLFSVKESYVERYKLIDRTSIMICAPKKQFDLKGLSKLGSMFNEATSITVPDPVVLQPVKGGYLILAAWGEEASDEIVVNQQMN